MKDEALKLALEALEFSKPAWASGVFLDGRKAKHTAAITAIKQALEQPAFEQYTALEQALTRLQKRYGELEAKVAAQPAPVQGLVACQYGDGGYACCEGGPCKADEQNNAAQPAPVQEFTCSTGLCHYKALPDPIHHTDLSEHPEYISGWNDYRQAMMEMMK